jgi:hypothetical protein
VEVYGMGVAVGDYNNDGFPDILITCVGQNRLFKHERHVCGQRASGLGGRLGFSTSAIWFDYDRDSTSTYLCAPRNGRRTRCVLQLTGNISYCTPEAYQGKTCWLFPQSWEWNVRGSYSQQRRFRQQLKSWAWPCSTTTRTAGPIVGCQRYPANKLYRNQRTARRMWRWKGLVQH